MTTSRTLVVGNSEHDNEPVTVDIPDDMSDETALAAWAGTVNRVQWPEGFEPAGVTKWRSVLVPERWAQIETGLAS